LAYEFLVCSFAINFILYSALHTALNKWVWKYNTPSTYVGKKI
jgi:hypothetical protein